MFVKSDKKRVHYLPVDWVVVEPVAGTVSVVVPVVVSVVPAVVKVEPWNEIVLPVGVDVVSPVVPSRSNIK